MTHVLFKSRDRKAREQKEAVSLNEEDDPEKVTDTYVFFLIAR